MSDPSLCISALKNVVTSSVRCRAPSAVYSTVPWPLQGGQGQTRHRWTRVALGAPSPGTSLLGTAGTNPTSTAIYFWSSSVFWVVLCTPTPFSMGAVPLHPPLESTCLLLTQAGDKHALVSLCRQPWPAPARDRHEGHSASE